MAPSAESARRRRTSTKRDVEIHIADGFVFKKKRKPPTDGEESGAPAAKHPRVDEKRDDDFKAEEKQAAGVRSRRVPRQTRPKLAYPLGGPAPEFAKTRAAKAEDMVECFFEELLAVERQKIDATFTGEHSFVAKALGDISAQFLKQVAVYQAVTKTKSTRDASVMKDEAPAFDSGFRNPRNQQLVQELNGWKETSQLVALEVRAWRDVLETWEREAQKNDAALFAPATPGSVPDYVSEQDREFLAKSCAGLLSATLPLALTSLCVNSDAILLSVRTMLDEAEKARDANRELAVRVNAVSGAALFAENPKRLIKSLVANPMPEMPLPASSAFPVAGAPAAHAVVEITAAVSAASSLAAAATTQALPAHSATPSGMAVVMDANSVMSAAEALSDAHLYSF